jgi:hypothetical protein
MELKYKEIVVTDISMNKSFIRKTVKLQLEKKGIPTKAGILAMLNEYIDENYNDLSDADEITIWIYLKDMNTDRASFMTYILPDNSLELT